MAKPEQQPIDNRRLVARNLDQDRIAIIYNRMAEYPESLWGVGMPIDSVRQIIAFYDRLTGDIREGRYDTFEDPVVATWQMRADEVLTEVVKRDPEHKMDVVREIERIGNDFDPYIAWWSKMVQITWKLQDQGYSVGRMVYDHFKSILEQRLNSTIGEPEISAKNAESVEMISISLDTEKVPRELADEVCDLILFHLRP